MELLAVMHDGDGTCVLVFDQIPITFVPNADEDVEFYDDGDVLLCTMDDSFLFLGRFLAITRPDSPVADGYYILVNAPKVIQFANGATYTLKDRYTMQGNVWDA